MKKTFFLTFAILLAGSVYTASAQEEKSEMKIFGMGLQFDQMIYFFDYSMLPSSKILFTITPMKNFRIEPEIGLSLYKDKDDDLTDQGLYYGAGFFGMFQKGQTNFYGGLRFELGNVKNNYISYYSGYETKEEMKYNLFSVGPAFGAEYLFGKHFSLGGEIGLIYTSGKSTDSQDDEESKYSTFRTDTGVLLRFYF